MVAACGRTRRVTLGSPPRSPTRRPAEAPRAMLTAAAAPLHTTPLTPPLPQPPTTRPQRPRLFRGLYTGPGRIFWNDAARDVTGLERSRTRGARDVTDCARGGRGLGAGPGSRSVFDSGRRGRSRSAIHSDRCSGRGVLASCRLLSVLMW